MNIHLLPTGERVTQPGETYTFQIGAVSTVPRTLSKERAQAEAQRIADRTSQRVVVICNDRVVQSVSPSWSGAAA